jgi:hypothetical protein
MVQTSALITIVLAVVAAATLSGIIVASIAESTAKAAATKTQLAALEAAVNAKLVALTALEDAATVQLAAIDAQLAVLDAQIADLNTTTSGTASDLQERFIETMYAAITDPTGYAGVRLRNDLYYAKNGSRVRMVLTLPDGYLKAAAVAVDHNGFFAAGVLPAWACRIDSRPDLSYNSISITDRGGFWFVTGTANDKDQQQMAIDNNPVDQGFWQLVAMNTIFTGLDVYLGVDECNNFNATACFPDYIGEMVTTLIYQPDIDAWDAQYDAVGA